MGHTGRDCPKPTDWSRVECSNCKQKGHTFKRCTNPPADADGDEIGGGDGAAGGGWGAGDTAPAGSSGGW
ncbi:hypothetical protein EJ03DRAFT_328225 [Teratosphaeria nubilosa]|uniref:CCHC-type domain-containing protein n=1 Tax=Teratosphaeria nubilosa TaxID=161662 RepID=A0A6G1L6L1_9PEZI|nr:hypothetical protein EJ03DRAFT_328225 [Teratosphaeria nubilosa]